MSDNPAAKRRGGMIADYLPLIEATEGLTLSQICLLSSLEATTIQNWIKRGFVPHPVRKKYRERHLARILLISELRHGMQIDRIGALLRFINGDTDETSDDIITEERLYDTFRSVTLLLDEIKPSPDRVGELVRENARASLADIPEPDREKIAAALETMAYGYIAGRYMAQADRMFNDILHIV